MFCAFGKYEHQADEAAPVKKQRTGFFEMFKALKGPMVPFFCSYSFSAASVGFFMTLLVYYTTYVLNDPAAAAKSLSWNAIVGLIGCLITPWLTKRLSKKAIHVGGMILSAVGYVALALFGSKALPFIAIRAAINLVGCPSTCVMSALCNDIGDNIEMQGSAPGFPAGSGRCHHPCGSDPVLLHFRVQHGCHRLCPRHGIHPGADSENGHPDRRDPRRRLRHRRCLHDFLQTGRKADCGV